MQWRSRYEVYYTPSSFDVKDNHTLRRGQLRIMQLRLFQGLR